MYREIHAKLQQRDLKIESWIQSELHNLKIEESVAAENIGEALDGLYIR